MPDTEGRQAVRVAYPEPWKYVIVDRGTQEVVDLWDTIAVARNERDNLAHRHEYPLDIYRLVREDEDAYEGM